jgi:hypothetical protein
MKISEAFPSRYLKAADLNGHHTTAVIDHIEVEDIDGRGKARPVLYFQGRTKGCVLNKTNGTVIAGALGDDTDTWPGKAVEIFPDQTTFQGRLVPCIRVRVPTPSAEDPNDDIPW